MSQIMSRKLLFFYWKRVNDGKGCWNLRKSAVDNDSRMNRSLVISRLLCALLSNTVTPFVSVRWSERTP